MMENDHDFPEGVTLSMTRVFPGFYADEHGSFYLCLGEFLDACGLPDTPEVRRIVLEQLSPDFHLMPPFEA